MVSPRRHPWQMPESPQLAHYFKDRTLHPISKWEASRPSVKCPFFIYVLSELEIESHHCDIHHLWLGLHVLLSQLTQRPGFVELHFSTGFDLVKNPFVFHKISLYSLGYFFILGMLSSHLCFYFFSLEIWFLDVIATSLFFSWNHSHFFRSHFYITDLKQKLDFFTEITIF